MGWGGGLFDYSVTPGPGPDLELDNIETKQIILSPNTPIMSAGF